MSDRSEVSTADSPNAAELLLEQLQLEWMQLLEQSVNRIDHCVSQLDADQIWWRPAADQNSIGAVLRHLAGNLKQWVVEGVPDIRGTRDRSAEFDGPPSETAEQLMAVLCQVVADAKQVLQSLTAAELQQNRSIQSFDVTVLGAIMHSVPHFVGHTHQIVQLTRLQLGESYRFHWTPEEERRHVPL